MNRQPTIERETNPVSDRHLTIGLLTHGAGDPNDASLWAGVADAARDREVNLICVPGKPLHSPIGFDAQANVIFDLIDDQTVNGLVIWGGALAHHASEEEMHAFYERFRSIPVVSIALALEGVSSVLVDNRQGMYDAVQHLIEEHGCRRIAFSGPQGHPEAEARRQAYAKALDDAGISLDPALIVPGAFSEAGREAGREAIRLLLKERAVPFDALACATDVIAAGAIDELKHQGLHVPADVAVIGFDDLDEARVTAPPLTTVSFGAYEQGYRATEILMDHIAGRKGPQQLVIPMRLIIRQSCGCMAPEVAEATSGSVEPLGEPSRPPFGARRDEIVAAMVAVAPPGSSADRAWAEQLVDTLAAELDDHQTGAFLSTLEGVLSDADRPTGWHSVISALRRHALPGLVGADLLIPAENLWQQARVMIGLEERRHEIYQGWQRQQQAQVLRKVNQQLITTIEMDQLMEATAEQLPRLGISRCYLSLYEDPDAPTEQARLILAYDENGRIELGADEQRFPSRQLAPRGLLHRERRYTMMVEPLYFRQDQIGFALFEVGPRSGILYETLRGQLSSALKGALLFQERKQAEAALQKAYGEVEQQVEERTAELKREIAERQRAQAESQRLQQEIIEAQKRAIQELSTPVIPVMDAPGGAGGIIVMPLIGSIDTLRARDIMRTLLAGIREHRAKVVILDITGVLIVDSGVANHLNKTIQAARLKGARTIVTGVSDAVAETIVDLGIDWSDIETLADLQTGLIVALNNLGIKLVR